MVSQGLRYLMVSERQLHSVSEKRPLTLSRFQESIQSFTTTSHGWNRRSSAVWILIAFANHRNDPDFTKRASVDVIYRFPTKLIPWRGSDSDGMGGSWWWWQERDRALIRQCYERCWIHMGAVVCCVSTPLAWSLIWFGLGAVQHAGGSVSSDQWKSDNERDSTAACGWCLVRLWQCFSRQSLCLYASRILIHSHLSLTSVSAVTLLTKRANTEWWQPAMCTQNKTHQPSYPTGLMAAALGLNRIQGYIG